MKKITVSGGKRLCGEVDVSGSKNAALPIIFACILTKGVSEIRNLPDIGDVLVALDILKSFGAKITFLGGVAYIDTENLSYTEPSGSLVSKIRASTYLIGSCLARFGRCPILSFGGCNFSKRPIDMHIDACISLGAELIDDELIVKKLRGNFIDFKKQSVGATVNALLMASVAEGETIIGGGAREPHIDALIEFLISCGADIKRIGTDLCIKGRELHGGRISIIGDMIEAGSYLVAGLITHGDVAVKNCPTEDMKAIFDALNDIGSDVLISDKSVKATMIKSKSINIIASPYPGFPTDLQPIFAPLLAAFSGGEIRDTVWQTRFGYLDALSNFGVEYLLADASASIKPSIIKNGVAISPDLRGGMACLLAALSSKGDSEIYSAEVILRGYEDLDKKLSALGADIKIENT